MRGAYGIGVVCSLLLVLGGAGCGGGSSSDGGGGSFSTFQPAFLVIGQPDFTSGDTNRGSVSGPVANGFGQSTSVRVDGVRTFVADWSNSRVLGFAGAPPQNDPTGNVVVGQPDFQTGGAGLAANRLDHPRGVFASGGRLYVADTDNNRVLIWNTIPLADEGADVVLGQATLSTNTMGSGQGGLHSPTSVFAVGNRVIVADRDNRRVLVWNTSSPTNGQSASFVLGQPDFATTSSGTSQSKMSLPVVLWSDGTRLVVSDYANHRILIWLTFPNANGSPADVVVGQPDFDTGSSGGGQSGLNYPGGVTSDGTRLFVADSSNHRILVYEQFPTQNGAMPDVVLGQSDFLHTAQDDDDQDGTPDTAPTARTLYGPQQLTAHEGLLYVPDFYNHRVLVFAPQ